MQLKVISKQYVKFIIVETTVSIRKTIEYEITKQTEYLTPTKSDQHMPGILIHAKHSFKIFLRCMHILKRIITFNFFFMNVIIMKLGEIECNGELLRFTKFAIKYVKHSLKHIRLIGRFRHYCFGQTLKAVLQTEGLLFK